MENSAQSDMLLQDKNAGITAQTIGAFFDVDETLVRGATIFWAVKEGFYRRVIGVRDLAYVARETMQYMLFGERGEEKIGEFTNRAASVVDGSSVAEMREIGDYIFERYFVPKVYQATLERLQAHVRAGNQVWLVSATPWIIAEVFASRIGATGGIGTRTKVSGGLLVGELDGGIVHGINKVAAVKSIAEEHGIDLDHSWAYSDSANDIPMLTLVGNPVAVNPDKDLAAYARNHDWEILVAREHWDQVKRTAAKAGLAIGAGAALWMTYRAVKKLL